MPAIGRQPDGDSSSGSTPRVIPLKVPAVERETSVSILSARPETIVRQSYAMADGTLEVLKWGAFVLMVLDHINKYFFAEQLPLVFPIGRIVMPIFGFALAYNLVRPGALLRGVHTRMMFRLSLTGLAATPVVVILNEMTASPYAWWPLNVLFTLLLVVVLTYLIERGGFKNFAAAITLFVIGGTFVEYLWFGVLCCLGAWAYCREPSIRRLLLWSLGTLSLTLVNGNAWEMMAIPLVLASRHVMIRCPRRPLAFYMLYPGHLLALLFVYWVWR